MEYGWGRIGNDKLGKVEVGEIVVGEGVGSFIWLV
jgi:hypothetical protein